MTSFGQQIKHSGKTNNHAASVRAKIAIRRYVLAAIHDARVFDAFAGSGKMYREVWHLAAGYVGCDLRWFRDERSAYVAKNQRVLRAVDLADYNLFDFDAYGSPWEQVAILAARRRLLPGERIGLVLTDGSGLKLKMGQCPKALAALCGMPNITVPGVNRVHDTLIDRAMDEACRRLRGYVVARWDHARPGKSEMRYLGVVIEGQ